MAVEVTPSDGTVEVVADGVAALFDNGWLDIYGPTRPVDADTVLGAQVLLASLRWGNPAFAASVAGAAIANPLTPDTSANAAGNITFFRAYRADHTTVIMDGNADTADADLIVSSIATLVGALVR